MQFWRPVVATWPILYYLAGEWWWFRCTLTYRANRDNTRLGNFIHTCDMLQANNNANSTVIDSKQFFILWCDKDGWLVHTCGEYQRNGAINRPLNHCDKFYRTCSCILRQQTNEKWRCCFLYNLAILANYSHAIFEQRQLQCSAQESFGHTPNNKQAVQFIYQLMPYAI